MSVSFGQLRRWAAARVWVLPALMLLAVTLPHLNQGDFRTDTGWYSAIGLQAWRTGRLWTLWAEPGRAYFNKPPLVFWIHGVVLEVLGPHVWAARLPSVAAAAGCVLAAVGVAREFFGRRAALVAGGVLALTLEFFRRTREMSLDMWQAMFLLAALWMAARAVRRGRWGLIAAAGVPIGLALMCKPLVGLAFVPLVAVWLAWIGEGRRAWWLGVTAAVAVAIAAPWHISMAVEHGAEFWGQYFGTEIVDRATGVLQAGHDEPVPWWFYLRQLAVRGWPWIACVSLALARWGRGGLGVDRRGWRLAVVWTAGWLVLLSVFADRRDRYALPYQPGLAMLAAGWLAHPVGPAGARAVRWSVRWVGVIVVLVGVVIAALPIRIQSGPDEQWVELFAWLRSQHLASERPERVYGGAFSGPHGARVYLEFGWWPRPTRDVSGREVVRPPAGSYVLYESHDGAGPGRGEEKVFESGSVVVTRVREPAAGR